MKNQSPSGESNARHRSDDLSPLHADNSGICPPVEEITRFVLGQAPKNTRVGMLKHFNHCADCRHLWLQTASFLGQIKAEKKPAKFIAWMPRPVFWRIAVPVFAVVLVVIALPNFRYDDLSLKINESAAFLAENPSATMMFDDLPVFADQPMAFNRTPEPEPIKAFSAGLDSISEIFSGKSHTVEQIRPDHTGRYGSQSILSDYYQFGRWIGVLWVAAKSEHTAEQWRIHLEILGQLRARLVDHGIAKRKSELAIDFLDSLQPLLMQLRLNTTSMAYSDLQRQVEIIVATFTS